MEDKKEVIQFGLATVTSKGLLFQDKYYSSANMIKNKWFENAEREGEWCVPVLFWSSNLERLVLIGNNSHEIATSVVTNDKCSLEDLQSYYERFQYLKDMLLNQTRFE